MKNKLMRWGQPAIPIPRKPESLIPHIPTEPPPSLLLHPNNPFIPIRDPFVFPVNKPDVYQKLSICLYGQVGKNTAHEFVPIVYFLAIIPLLCVGWTGKTQARFLAPHEPGHVLGLRGIP